MSDSEATQVLSFVCPHCRSRLTVPSELAGISGPCPDCGREIRSPESSENPLEQGRLSGGDESEDATGSTLPEGLPSSEGAEVKSSHKEQLSGVDLTQGHLVDGKPSAERPVAKVHQSQGKGRKLTRLGRRRRKSRIFLILFLLVAIIGALGIGYLLLDRYVLSRASSVSVESVSAPSEQVRFDVERDQMLAANRDKVVATEQRIAQLQEMKPRAEEFLRNWLQERGGLEVLGGEMTGRFKPNHELIEFADLRAIPELNTAQLFPHRPVLSYAWPSRAQGAQDVIFFVSLADDGSLQLLEPLVEQMAQNEMEHFVRDQTPSAESQQFFVWLQPATRAAGIDLAVSDQLAAIDINYPGFEAESQRVFVPSDHPINAELHAPSGSFDGGRRATITLSRAERENGEIMVLLDSLDQWGWKGLDEALDSPLPPVDNTLALIDDPEVLAYDQRLNHLKDEVNVKRTDVTRHIRFLIDGLARAETAEDIIPLVALREGTRESVVANFEDFKLNYTPGDSVRIEVRGMGDQFEQPGLLMTRITPGLDWLMLVPTPKGLRVDWEYLIQHENKTLSGFERDNSVRSERFIVAIQPASSLSTDHPTTADYEIYRAHDPDILNGSLRFFVPKSSQIAMELERGLRDRSSRVATLVLEHLVLLPIAGAEAQVISIATDLTCWGVEPGSGLDLPQSDNTESIPSDSESESEPASDSSQAEAEVEPEIISEPELEPEGEAEPDGESTPNPEPGIFIPLD